MKLLLLDNYDSFTYNLAQIIEENWDGQLDIVKNDQIEIHEVESYDAIILSPGPGLPQEAGMMPTIIKKYHALKPILGVCLGHQALAEFFGARLKNLDAVYHGVHSDTEVIDNENIIFQGVSNPFKAGRYHSWAVEKVAFPSSLIISAQSTDGEIMALRHQSLPLYGVQFHPESYLTKEGEKMVKNFLNKIVLKREK